MVRKATFSQKLLIALIIVASAFTVQTEEKNMRPGATTKVMGANR